nr:hypothetical protein [Tanacetum cinerariifolium]
EQINKIDFINAGGIDFESEEIEDFLNEDSIPFRVEDSPFNMDEDILFLESLLREDPIPPHPIILNQTKLPIKEPNHSLNMGYDHFNTNLVTKDVAESSTKNLIPIPNECMVVSKNRNEEVDAIGDLRVDNFIQNSEHEYSESEESDFDNLPLPLPPPEPPDKKFDFEKEISVPDEHFNPGGEIFVSTNIEDVDFFPFMFVIRIFLPYLILLEISPLFLSAESEDTIFDP